MRSEIEASVPDDHGRQTRPRRRSERISKLGSEIQPDGKVIHRRGRHIPLTDRDSYADRKGRGKISRSEGQDKVKAHCMKNPIVVIVKAEGNAKSEEEKPLKKKRTKKLSPYFPLDFHISSREAISDTRFGLLQEVYAPDPYKVLIVAMFLTQTPGHRARPFIHRFFERYPNACILSQADVEELAEEIRPLGLHVIRATRFKLFGEVYLCEPPIPGKVSFKKGIPKRMNYPPTEVSHLPGCGPYALDCYRIFCTPDGWRSVRPEDKELKPYIQWRWALEGVNYLDMWKSDPTAR